MVEVVVVSVWVVLSVWVVVVVLYVVVEEEAMPVKSVIVTLVIENEIYSYTWIHVYRVIQSFVQ